VLLFFRLISSGNAESTLQNATTGPQLFVAGVLDASSNEVVERICAFRALAEKTRAFDKFLTSQRNQAKHAPSKKVADACSQISVVSFWLALDSCSRGCAVSCNGHNVFGFQAEDYFRGELDRLGFNILCRIASVSDARVATEDDWTRFSVGVGYDVKIGSPVKGAC
jgi:hypothetical protein